MNKYIRSIFISIISIMFILILKENFDESLEKTKSEFFKSELNDIESIATKLVSNIKDDVFDNQLYYTLKGNPSLRQIHENNLKLVINNKHKYAYVVCKDVNERFKILLDGSVTDKSEFNEPIAVINESWNQIYKQKKPMYFKEDSIEDTIWMTYLYPILIDNEVQAILAIDFDVDEIEKSLSYLEPLQQLLSTVLYSFIVLVSIFLFLLVLWYLKNKKVIEQEKTIEETRNFYKALLDSQQNIVITFDKEAILNVNQRFFDFFKVKSIDEFNIKFTNLQNCFAVVNQDNYLSKGKENWQQIVSKDKDDNFKAKILDAIFSVKVQTIEYQKKHIEIVVLNNITNLEEAQIKATEANKSKSEFLANMSHEIRTPMNAIMGLTDLVLNTKLNAKQENYLKKVKISTVSLLRIINEILDFSKIEAGKMSLEYTPCQVFSFVEKIQQMFETQSEEDKTEFQIFVDPKLPKAFIADSLRLEQVLINLLGNAFKFTKGGSVELHLRNIVEGKYNFSMEVKDTGIGIEKEKIDSLFESFTQEDASTTRKYGGTGLGLSITKSIIDMFDGKIEVKSEKNLGSSFTVYLYLEEFKNSEESKNETNHKDALYELKYYHDINILIAEDNKINQDVIAGYLSPLDINIAFANDGKECVEKFEKGKFDLIFMDINMPEKNGYEATADIRQIDKNIPIVALSANARSEDFKLSIDNGMNAHLVKPINPQILYKTFLEFIPKDKKKNFKKDTITSTTKNTMSLEYIDVQKTIENLHNNENLFIKILTRFLNDYENISSHIDDLVQNNEYKELEEVFHKLTSSSGSIGATKLFYISDYIHKALQEEKFSSNEIKTMKVSLAHVIKDIKLYLSVQNKVKILKSNKNEELSDFNEVEKCFLELKESLEAGDIKTVKQVIKKIEKLALDESTYKAFNSAKSNIDLYNFEEALKSLEEGKI